MSDIQLSSTPPASRAQRAPGRLGDIVFGGLTRLSAVVTLLLLGGIIVSLLVASLPTLQIWSQFSLARGLGSTDR